MGSGVVGGVDQWCWLMLASGWEWWCCAAVVVAHSWFNRGRWLQMQVGGVQHRSEETDEVEAHELLAGESAPKLVVLDRESVLLVEPSWGKEYLNKKRLMVSALSCLRQSRQVCLSVPEPSSSREARKLAFSLGKGTGRLLISDSFFWTWAISLLGEAGVHLLGGFEQVGDQHQQVDQHLVARSADLEVLEKHVHAEHFERLVDDVFVYRRVEANAAGPFDLGADGDERQAACGSVFIELVELAVERLGGGMCTIAQSTILLQQAPHNTYIPVIPQWGRWINLRRGEEGAKGGRVRRWWQAQRALGVIKIMWRHSNKTKNKHRKEQSSDPSSSNPSTHSSSDFAVIARYSHDVILLQNQVIAALHHNHKLLEEVEKNGYFEEQFADKRQNCIIKEVSELLDEQNGEPPSRGLRLRDSKASTSKKKQEVEHSRREKSLQEKSLRQRSLSSRSNHELRQQAYFCYKRENYNKNLIKNFAQAILGFIRDNRKLKRRVLRELAIAEGEFERVCCEFQDMVQSFSDFKLLWTRQGNPFHKAFRILSYKYLNENCLQEIFLSRVENTLTHLKCRTLLLEGLRFPEKLTIFKAY